MKMARIIEVLCWLLLCFLCSVASYMHGVDRGAHRIGEAATSNSIARSFSRVDTTLAALQRRELLYSLRLHGVELDDALQELGAHASARTRWNCSDRDRRILANARDYFDGKLRGAADATDAARSRPKVSPLIAAALDFCVDPDQSTIEN